MTYTVPSSGSPWQQATRCREKMDADVQFFAAQKWKQAKFWRAYCHRTENPCRFTALHGQRKHKILQHPDCSILTGSRHHWQAHLLPYHDQLITLWFSFYLQLSAISSGSSLLLALGIPIFGSSRYRGFTRLIAAKFKVLLCLFSWSSDPVFPSCPMSTELTNVCSRRSREPFCSLFPDKPHCTNDPTPFATLTMSTPRVIDPKRTSGVSDSDAHAQVGPSCFRVALGVCGVSAAG